MNKSNQFSWFKFCAMPFVIFFVGFVAFGLFRYWLNPMISAAATKAFTKNCLYAISVGDASVSRVQFTPDGTKLLVFGGSQKKVVDAENGAVLHQFPKNASVHFSIAPDSSLVAVPNYKGPLSLMNIDGSLVSTVDMTTDLPTSFLPVAFAPQVRGLVAPGKDGFFLYKYNGDRVTKVPSRIKLGRLVVTPDGNTIIATEESGGISMWSFNDFNEFKRTEAHKGKIERLKVSSDGRLLATMGSDKTIKIWEVAELKLISTLEPGVKINDFDWNWGGKILVSALADGTVVAWDVATTDHVKTWQFNNSVHTISISPDATKLALGFSKVTHIENRPQSRFGGSGYTVRGESVTPGVAIVIASKFNESEEKMR